MLRRDAVPQFFAGLNAGSMALVPASSPRNSRAPSEQPTSGARVVARRRFPVRGAVTRLFTKMRSFSSQAGICRAYTA